MKLVMLDRDGVLNEDRADYVKHPGELVMIQRAAEACALLNRAGVKVALVSNQSVVGRGIISEEMLERIHAKLRGELSAAGARLDLVLTCTDAPWSASERRKPAPGMLREALAHFRLPREEAVMIGDQLSDLAAAQAAINLVNSGVSFADAAVEMSSDSSAARGGLLEPISQSDPNYPEALRQTLFSLNPGAMSGPVLLNDKYAVVLMVKRIAADGVTLDDARPALERMVRINQERLLMDQMARRLTLDTTVTVFDDELNDSWQRARRK